MKGQNQNSESSCNIHPIDFIEGVCPLCLNERLLVLKSLQRLKPKSPPPASYYEIQEPKTILRNSSKKKLTKLFSLLGFFELRHHKSNHQTNSIISPEDSFISIKFDEKVATSWERVKGSSQLEKCKASLDHQYQQVILHTKKKEIVPQSKPRPLLIWKRRISQLLHVITLKSRSSYSSAKVKGDDDDLGRTRFPTNKKNHKLITSQRLR